MTAQIIKGQPMHEYLSMPETSRGELWAALQGPRSWRAYREEEHEESTASQSLGDVVHTYILDPETFPLRFAMEPDVTTGAYERFANPRASKAYKDAIKALKAANPNAAILKRPDYIKAVNIAASVADHRIANALLTHRELTEATITFEMDGNTFRIRPDTVCLDALGRPAVVDLKTAADPTERAFRASAEKYGYVLSPALYCRGVQEALSTDVVVDFYWLVVGTQAPHHVVVYRASEQMMARSNAMLARALGKRREYLSGTVPLDQHDFPDVVDLDGYDDAGDIQNISINGQKVPQ